MPVVKITYAFSSKEEGSGAVLRGPAMVKDVCGGGGRVVCDQWSSKSALRGGLWAVLKPRRKIKLCKAQGLRGEAVSEV